MRPAITRACIAAISVCMASQMFAEFVEVETRKVPIQRLVANIERQLRNNPNDIELRLNLARLYAMAYALKVGEFPAYSTGGDNLAPWFGNVPPNVPERTKPGSQEQQQSADAHLQRAIQTYEDVIQRKPDHFVAHLGYAWSLEHADRKVEAVAEYRKVVELAWPIEQKGASFSMATPATTEAADRLRVLLNPVNDQQELASLRDKTRELERRVRAITPIVIPLEGDMGAAPTDPESRVLFDADGSGVPRRWTWVEPNAGWLVHDADGRGEITSALQWFGNVTFWLFWANGYHALTALDDNGDGELRGTELRDLAIWRDKNQNGVSERGEVRPLAAYRIVAVSSAYVRGDGVTIEAYSPRGVRFEDGSTRTSYDVILLAIGRPLTLPAASH
jgi:hypothetical protein